MTIMQYHSFARPQRVENDIRQLCNRFFADGERAGEWTPRVDIREEQQRFVILADIPGVEPKDIEISTDKGMLSIKGARASETNEENGTLTRVERSSGTFQRTFSLPDSVDAEGISAVGKHGVLEVSIPKKPQAAPRKIEVTH
ncbi:MAG: Hsp20/alpha crystallin family protein [Rudaea sp.]